MGSFIEHVNGTDMDEYCWTNYGRGKYLYSSVRILHNGAQEIAPYYNENNSVVC